MAAVMTSLNILLAADDSEAALHAARLVAAYRGDAALRVTLLHVQRPPLRLSVQGGVDQVALEAALHEEGRHRLERARGILDAAGVKADVLVRIGMPAQTVLDVAREIAPDVLVMGGGRKGVAGGYALGSVALRVAPAASCAVVLVTPGMRLPTEAGRRLRVAMPVDGSPEASTAVQRLAACAAVLGTLQVDLVHFQPGLTLAAAMLPPHDDVLRQWSGNESALALQQAQQLLSDAGIAHQVHSLTGEPETAIAAFAQEQGAELVAMGSRGLGAMHHLLLGSVALGTVQCAGVPVAILR